MHHVGGRVVLRSDRPPHPLLVPPDLVHPVVMAAGEGYRRVVELGMEEQGAERVLAARRTAVDTDAGDVVGGILLRRRLVPEDAIGEAGVSEVLPGDVMECLRAVAGAHP